MLVKILGSVRVKTGTNNSRKLRKNNKIPAIIYGKNYPSISIEIDQKNFFNIQIKNITSNYIINIIINDKIFPVKIKKIQNHPFKQKIYHIDFLIID